MPFGCERPPSILTARTRLFPAVSTSRSEFVRIRGLRYHVRHWGEPGQPILFLLHGLLDASATFAELVQPLRGVCRVIAPDWRGFGHSEWPADGYWFPDYVADFDALAAHYAPDAPFWLAGHSMGGQAASLYAGLAPERIGKLVLLDSLFMPETPADAVTTRYRRWLQQLRMPMRAKTYASFDALAERVRVQHPQLSAERARFVAQGWGAEDGKHRVRLLADPRHRLNMPMPYRSEDAMAIWRQVTAPTLFIDGGLSEGPRWIGADEQARRRGCFARHEQLSIAGAGHMLHFDAPLETGRAIAAFLQR